MDPVSLAAAATGSAVAIAKAAGLGDWLKARFDGKPGAKTAEKIIDLAGKVVGGGPPEEILERLHCRVIESSPLDGLAEQLAKRLGMARPDFSQP